MAGYDVEKQDPLTFFRTEVSPADLARAKHEWEIQAQRDHQAMIVGWAVVSLFGLLLAFAAILHRRKIARSADVAVISSLASGVRTARKAKAARDAWLSRILAKADEKPSTLD